MQIWLSMEVKRVVGLRRLATTFKPVPLKNLSRQVKFLTVWGFGMSVSSALTRACDAHLANNLFEDVVFAIEACKAMKLKKEKTGRIIGAVACWHTCTRR